MTGDEVWAGVDGPWRRAVELAWEAFVGGSIAVGAVVLGPDGDVIAEGRNRSGETVGPAGQVVGSSIAHAEVNALAGVPLGTPGPTTLLSTLEPCVMCTTVCRFGLLEHVRYLAVDPIWAGAERIAELNAFYARRDPTRQAVDLGRVSTWCGALALLSGSHQRARRAGTDIAAAHAASPVTAASPYADAATVLIDAGLAPDTDLTLDRALAAHL